MIGSWILERDQIFSWFFYLSLKLLYLLIFFLVLFFPVCCFSGFLFNFDETLCQRLIELGDFISELGLKNLTLFESSLKLIVSDVEVVDLGVLLFQFCDFFTLCVILLHQPRKFPLKFSSDIILEMTHEIGQSIDN